MQSVTPNVGVTVVSSKQEKRRFLEFPYQHYKGDEYWVPPLRIQQKELLDEKKNPFFRNAEIKMFLGESNGRPAGRIAAIIDHRYNEFHSAKTGFFGFFECEFNPSLADLLFKAAGDWLRSKGMRNLLGPSNPGMMDEIGVLVDGFSDLPAILMPYHKTYYDELLTGIGLRKEMDLYSYVVSSDTVQFDRLTRAFDLIMQRYPGLSIREVDMKRFSREVKIIREIFNKAWERNWGFIPLTEAEFDHLAEGLKQVIDPALCHIVEYEGVPVGFSIPLPDYNRIFHKMNGRLFPFGLLRLLHGRNRLTKMRTALMGVVPEHRGKGIDALLHQQLIQKGLKKGYTVSELGWVLETNIDMVRVAERIGSTDRKVYRMYGREI